MPPCRKIPSTKAVHGVKLVAENVFWPKKNANLDQRYGRRHKLYFADQLTERKQEMALKGLETKIISVD